MSELLTHNGTQTSPCGLALSEVDEPYQQQQQKTIDVTRAAQTTSVHSFDTGLLCSPQKKKVSSLVRPPTQTRVYLCFISSLFRFPYLQKSVQQVLQCAHIVAISIIINHVLDESGRVGACLRKQQHMFAARDPLNTPKSNALPPLPTHSLPNSDANPDCQPAHTFSFINRTRSAECESVWGVVRHVCACVRLVKHAAAVIQPLKVNLIFDARIKEYHRLHAHTPKWCVPLFFHSLSLCLASDVDLRANKHKMFCTMHLD